MLDAIGIDSVLERSQKLALNWRKCASKSARFSRPIPFSADATIEFPQGGIDDALCSFEHGATFKLRDPGHARHDPAGHCHIVYSLTVGA